MKMMVVGSDGFVGTAIGSRSRFKDNVIGVSPVPVQGEWPLDLRKPEEFDYSALPDNCTIVFVAAISSPDYCTSKHQEASEINVVGSGFFIARALARGCRVIFFSSDVVFGRSSGPIDEDSPMQPLGAYGEMKAAIEERFLGNSGFKVLRPSYIVSVKDKFSSYLLGCAKAGRPAEVFHPLLRSALHLDDVVAAVDSLHENWALHHHPAVNLCGPRLVSRKELAGILRAASGLEIDYKVVEAPPGFFESRPPLIEMKSLHLEGLLGRPPLDLEGALRKEFERERT